MQSLATGISSQLRVLTVTPLLVILGLSLTVLAGVGSYAFVSWSLCVPCADVNFIRN